MTKLLVAVVFIAAVVGASAQTAFAEPNGGGSGGSSNDCQTAQQNAGALNSLANIEEEAAKTDPYGFGAHIANATTFRIVAQQMVNDACGVESPEIMSADSGTSQETVGTPASANCIGQTISSLAQLGDTLGSPGIGGVAQLSGMSVTQVNNAVVAFCNA